MLKWVVYIIYSIKLNTTEYTEYRVIKSTVFNSFNEIEKKRKKTYTLSRNECDPEISGVALLFDAENWFCLALHVRSRSPCPEPMCVIYSHFTREHGSFFVGRQGIEKPDQHGTIGIGTCYLVSKPYVFFPNALLKYNRRLTTCHWFLCPLIIPDQTR